MSTPIDRLVEIMTKLRDPETGCPWDKQQSFATIAPHTIEEAYEVADAIEHRDMEALKDELGDLLFQVVFYAQMAREAGAFDFNEVAAGIAEKMVRRHPHVFGEDSIASVQAQSAAWEEHKARERSEKAETGPAGASVLDGVARALPALARARKLQNRAARVGFDWPEAFDVIAKIEEEIAEVRNEILSNAPPCGLPARSRGFAPASRSRTEGRSAEAGPKPPAFAKPASAGEGRSGDGPAERLRDEIGDLLFACANLARKLEIDPETALSRANGKFERRFRRIEALLAERGKTPAQSSLEEMDELWNQAKAEEREQG